MRRSRGLLALLLVSACGSRQPPSPAPPPTPPRAAAAPLATRPAFRWKKLDTVAYKGKQDDIFFANGETGFYVNGEGNIYKTTDGGKTWTNKLHKPGTYFRALGFLNELTGFAGTVGTDYFPGVTDPTPLYVTHDGGDTWAPVNAILGDPVKGVCAIDVLWMRFINAGALDERVILHAGGRVGGPAVFLSSDDGGGTWVARDMSAQAGMILDVKFVSRDTGFLCGGSSREVEDSHALILKTSDGGQTWVKKYESTRPFEDAWKCSFPSAKVGYATVQSYDEDKTHTERIVAKTTDGGETWTELPLVNDAGAREFGVGFLSEDVGWVGTAIGGFQTFDGGRTFTRTEMGKSVNRIRFVHRRARGPVGYAIGVDVYKLDPNEP